MINGYSHDIIPLSVYLSNLNQEELPYGGEGAPVCIERNGKTTLVAVYNSHMKNSCLGRRLTKELFNDMKKRLTFGK